MFPVSTSTTYSIFTQEGEASFAKAELSGIPWNAAARQEIFRSRLPMYRGKPASYGSTSQFLPLSELQQPCEKLTIEETAGKVTIATAIIDPNNDMPAVHSLILLP